MNLDNLESLLENEPRFRREQVDKLIYQNLITDWNEGTTLSLNLRKTLAEKVPLEIPAQKFISKDNQTEKALFTLKDGLKIESVLMRFENRNAVCVSSQVGCPLGCLFCATGAMGFKRNLTAGEIVNQVIFFARALKLENKKISNIVFMGMGEPFLNYEEVMKAVEIINNPKKFNLGNRHISISTAGIPEMIVKFTNQNLEVNLAISLHAPNNEIRNAIMPINHQYPIEEIIKVVKNHIKKTNRKVMFEYILLDGVNDSPENAMELAKIIRYPLFHLNLIQYNETQSFKGSTPEKAAKFKEVLKQQKIFFTERFRFGADINAACGQLATSSTV